MQDCLLVASDDSFVKATHKGTFRVLVVGEQNQQLMTAMGNAPGWLSYYTT